MSSKLKTAKKPGKTTAMMKMVGTVPLKTVLSAAKEGGYIAQVNFNGKQYAGRGKTPREATLELRRSTDKDASQNLVPTR